MKFFLNSLIFLVVLTLNKAYDFDYRYQSKWYDVNDQCSFNRQSPIEISSAERIFTKPEADWNE